MQTKLIGSRYGKQHHALHRIIVVGAGAGGIELVTRVGDTLIAVST
jgi:NADH dehydrogenase FAD-containing subunit